MRLQHAASDAHRLLEAHGVVSFCEVEQSLEVEVGILGGNWRIHHNTIHSEGSGHNWVAIVEGGVVLSLVRGIVGG